MHIVHSLAFKLRAVFRWSRAAFRHGSLIALAIVQVMIDVLRRSDPPRDTRVQRQ